MSPLGIHVERICFEENIVFFTSTALFLTASFPPGRLSYGKVKRCKEELPFGVHDPGMLGRLTMQDDSHRLDLLYNESSHNSTDASGMA
jgi:hypothetical protein